MDQTTVNDPNAKHERGKALKKMLQKDEKQDTVPFRLICPVTRHKAFGPVLISVHVTRHIDFGHM